ncbi:MAG: HAD-IA family hydrolase [archaeon]
MIKAIIFDFDGTLVDAIPIFTRNANILARKYGYPELNDFSKLRDRELKDIIENEMKIPLLRLPKYAVELKQMALEEFKKAKPFPGIGELLKALSAKYKLGILTSNSEEAVRAVLKDQPLDFVFSDSALFGKAEVLRRLLKEHNLKKDEIVYVGDETRDIEACKALGVKCVVVSWGLNSEKVLMAARPFAIAKDTKELLSILMRF